MPGAGGGTVSGAATWQAWSGDFNADDAYNEIPAQDRLLFDIFTATPDDDATRGQFDAVNDKGRSLHEKQHNGQPLNGQEIADFEKQRDALLKNPVARGFLEAQDELHEIQNSVQKYISKTLQLGRVPTAADLKEEEGSCGDGCGCHH